MQWCMSLKLLVKLHCFAHKIHVLFCFLFKFCWHMIPHLVQEMQHLIHVKTESPIDAVVCITQFKNTIQAAVENLVSDSSVLADHTAFAVSILKSLLILLIFNTQKFYEKSQTKEFFSETSPACAPSLTAKHLQSVLVTNAARRVFPIIVLCL